MTISPGGYLTTFTIYHMPQDIPGAQYAVRGWRLGPDGARPTPWLQVASTLEEARSLVPPASDTCFPRNDDDDPSIVETWM